MSLTLLLTLLMFLYQNGQEFYQQAMVQENAAGNLEAAIQLYQDAARYAGGNRELAAQALIGAARCYEKLGQAKAKELYEEVARTYSDVKQHADLARNRAAALSQNNERELRIVVHQQADGTRVQELVQRMTDARQHLFQVGPGMFWDRPPMPLPQFDTSGQGRIIFTATVAKIEWVSQSVTLVFDSGARLLAGPPAELINQGWTRISLRPGDAVTVEGFQGVDGLQGRDPRDTAALAICCATITLSDGRKLSTVNLSGTTRPQQ